VYTTNTSVLLTDEQRSKLDKLKGWMKARSVGEVLRELLETEHSRQILLRGEIDAPLPAGQGAHQLG